MAGVDTLPPAVFPAAARKELSVKGSPRGGAGDWSFRLEEGAGEGSFRRLCASDLALLIGAGDS